MQIRFVMKLVVLSVLFGTVARAEEAKEAMPLPPVTVTSEPILEETPVGPYAQPEWTTARRFPTTRVYLQQLPGEFGVEQWVKMQWPRGEDANYLFQEEVEVGLPWRFQFDLYENWRINEHGTVLHDSVSTEMRWALADWGKIPLNPTLYGEWVFRNKSLGADKYEVKLLLGEEIAPRWHWGLNFIFEQEVGATRTTEYGVSQGISYTVIDNKLSVGLEIKVESETEQGARSDAPIEVDIGPSLQWRPTRTTHIDIVPLFGVTGDSPHVEAWLIFGFDFGRPGERAGYVPVSTKSQ
jgi:hypothetical protein